MPGFITRLHIKSTQLHVFEASPAKQALQLHACGSRKLLRQMTSGIEFELCRRGGSSTQKSCNNNGRQVSDALHAGCVAHEHITVMAGNED